MPVACPRVLMRLQGKGPDGQVLTFTVTKEGRTRGLAHVVSEAPLQDVKVPVLLVHHKDDGCHVTPYDAMPAITSFRASRRPWRRTSPTGSRRRR